MYTQCPECEVAFRVTAEVLKQAAGKVRCGGCGVAFNALNHLSEHKPAAPVRADPRDDQQLPELTPPAAPDVPGELEADTPPRTISAAQSAALLKTLDQLAGSDIRIEDTGVEWRVLDEEEIDTSNGDAELPSEAISDTGSLRFILEGDDDGDLVVEPDDEPSQVIDQMRFDDDTPLPDDFDFLVEPAPEAQPPFEAPPPQADARPEPIHAQVDLALGAPEDWEDLLGDLVEPEQDATEEPADKPPEQVAAAEPEQPLAAIDALPQDMDTQFAIQAEAMGIDLSGLYELEADDASIDEETSIEDDLLAAAFEAEAAVQALANASPAEAKPAPDDDPDEDDIEDDAVEDEEIVLESRDDEELDDDDFDGFELQEVDEADDIEMGLDLDTEDDNAEDDIEIDLDLDAEDDNVEDDIEDIALPFDDDVENIIETIAASLDDEPYEEPEAEAVDPGHGYIIPEMTEEEKTINMLIDQELLSVAVEDEDGFASTIVQRQPDKKVSSELKGNKQDSGKREKSAPLFETIIMEGESIRGDVDRERLSNDFGDAGLSIPFKPENTKSGGRRAYDPPGVGTYVGIGTLILLLVLQALHQSREALATVPAFSSTVGPVYRLLGKPLTPTWNISGWRFEATKGSTESATVAESADNVATSEILTIYSRVGNKSEQALPYPLVHLSLTDRFEEIIGSTVLEPGEYLAENADPRKLVPPGNTFNAVISIDSPSAEATGFKLNVCYRLASGQLRCAIEDFK